MPDFFFEIWERGAMLNTIAALVK